MAAMVESIPAAMLTTPSHGSEHLEEIDVDLDPLSLRLRKEALEAERAEPELSALLRRTVLAPGVRTFEDAVSATVSFRLLNLIACTDMSKSTSQYDNSNNSNKKKDEPMFCPSTLRSILDGALASSQLELGHTMSEAVRADALAACDRDPACETLLEVVLFFKGYAAMVAHRAARRRWFDHLQHKHALTKRSFVALFLQSQASAKFGVDIHPAAAIGSGVLLDHGTGVVIGETAVVGDGCTILHGVTLGGTGKEVGDRHPKVGQRCLIGANTSILGNVKIGDGAKIGAGSIVLRSIPAGATAVGAPAKIIGRVKEADPGGTVDEVLEGVSLLHGIKNKNANKHQQQPKRIPSKMLKKMKQEVDGVQEEAEEGSQKEEKSKETKQEVTPAPEKIVETETEPATEAETKPDSDDAKTPSATTAEHPTPTSNPIPPSEAHLEPPPIVTKSKLTRTDTNTSSLASTTVTSETDLSTDDFFSTDDSDDSSDTNTNCICPFREISKLGQSAPPGTMTMRSLFDLLGPLGVTPTEVGEVFFALDTDLTGYVSMKVFRAHIGELVERLTDLDRGTLEECLKRYRGPGKRERGLTM